MTTALCGVREELACNVARFEQLVAEHSDRFVRIELLLDEIAAHGAPQSAAEFLPVLT